ncbi:MAG: hypothetical protein AAF539_01405 [Planctomycetota bacterium]
MFLFPVFNVRIASVFMSDDQTSTPNQAAPKSSGVRKGLLVVIFIGLIAALFYDYGVARPAVDDAYAAITQRFDEANAKAETLGSDDIDVLIDRPPASSFEDGDNEVQVYQWASGLPLRSHKLFVVYRDTPGSDESKFVAHFKYAYDSGSAMAVASADELLANRAAGTGRGQGEAMSIVLDKKANGKPDTGKAPAAADDANPAMDDDPENPAGDGDMPTLAELDKDGDGKIGPDEWLESLPGEFRQWDKDEDGQISAEELEAALNSAS